MHKNSSSRHPLLFAGASSPVKIILLSITVLTFSCKNDADVKAPEQKDSTAAGKGGGSATDSSNKKLSGKDSVDYVPGTKKLIDTARLSVKIKTKENHKDSTRAIAKNSDNKKENKAAENQATDNKLEPINNTDNAKTVVKPITANKTAPVENPDNFISKYGVIPRNATENNIGSFLEAFQDKTILVKINFDGPADAEMTAVKAQIIKALKKTGYTNISDQSTSIEPIRMPKEIHYELQRNGSVVIWVPIANNGQ